MTDKLRDAAQQALEALIQADQRDGMYSYELEIAALRAALAQQDVQQDVDWEKLYRLEVKKKESLAAKYERDIKPLTKIAPLAQTAQQDAQAVPHWWKLVPVEPTPEMVEAAKGGATLNPNMAALWYKGLIVNWHSMLNAAPTPPAQKNQ